MAKPNTAKYDPIPLPKTDAQKPAFWLAIAERCYQWDLEDGRCKPGARDGLLARLREKVL